MTRDDISRLFFPSLIAIDSGRDERLEVHIGTTIVHKRKEGRRSVQENRQSLQAVDHGRIQWGCSHPLQPSNVSATYLVQKTADQAVCNALMVTKGCGLQFMGMVKILHMHIVQPPP